MSMKKRKKIIKRKERRLKIAKAIMGIVFAVTMIYMFGLIGKCDIDATCEMPWKGLVVSAMIAILDMVMISKLEIFHEQIIEYKEKYLY